MTDDEIDRVAASLAKRAAAKEDDPFWGNRVHRFRKTVRYLLDLGVRPETIQAMGDDADRV